MAAPTPQPTKLAKVKGTYRKDRASKNELEVPALENIPSPPEHFSERTKEIFIHLATVLHDRGVLGNIDLYALNACAYNAGLMVEAEIELEQPGGKFQTITNKGGFSYEVKSPWIEIRYKAEASFVSWCSKFGLTPSDRAKIVMPEKKEKSRLDKLLEK